MYVGDEILYLKTRIMAKRVTLREKKISNGKISLYLDYYPPVFDPKTGKTKRIRKNLGIHVLEKPKTLLEKQQNKEKYQIAQQICAKEQNEFLKEEIYSDLEKERKERAEKGEQDFIPYFVNLANKRKSSNLVQQSTFETCGFIFCSHWIETFRYKEAYMGRSTRI